MKDLLESVPYDARRIADAIIAVGGAPHIVGGWVRDQLLGLDPKDIDIEVYGLPLPQLEEVLGQFGVVDVVGRHFGVLKVHGLDYDISLPRKDSKKKKGKGHCDFDIEIDHTLGPREAAQRRDFTINSMSLCLQTGELIDPYDGVEDLLSLTEDEQLPPILRAVDENLFGDDPLRALRAVQFIARFDAEIDSWTFQLCKAQDLSVLPSERIYEELKKLLLKAECPSIGLQLLKDMGHLKYFPELEALVDCEQDPVWHPEGTVWHHTLLVVDEAAKLRTGDEKQDLVLMFAALCHDLGKPTTTTYEVDDEEVDRVRFWDLYDDSSSFHIRSRGHEEEGAEPTRRFLNGLRASTELTQAVTVLVRTHLAPTLFPKQGAGPGAYRKLARRLGGAGTNIEMLYRLNRADHFGRTTSDALAREHPSGEEFLKIAEEAAVMKEAPEDVVMGRHLIAKGFKPGPKIGDILKRCRDYQYDTGETDPYAILSKILCGEDMLSKYQKPRDIIEFNPVLPSLPPPHIFGRDKAGEDDGTSLLLPGSETDE